MITTTQYAVTISTVGGTPHVHRTGCRDIDPVADSWDEEVESRADLAAVIWGDFSDDPDVLADYLKTSTKVFPCVRLPR